MKQRIIQWITSKRWMNGRVEMSWRLTVGGLWWHVDVDVQHVTMLRWFPIRLMDFADWMPTKCWLIASGCSFLLSAFILTDHRYGRLRWWCEWFGFIMDTGIEIKLDTYTLKHIHTHTEISLRHTHTVGVGAAGQTQTMMWMRRNRLRY